MYVFVWKTKKDISFGHIFHQFIQNKKNKRKKKRKCNVIILKRNHFLKFQNFLISKKNLFTCHYKQNQSYSTENKRKQYNCLITIPNRFLI